VSNIDVQRLNNVAKQVIDSGQILLQHPANEESAKASSQFDLSSYALGLPITVTATPTGNTAENDHIANKCIVAVVVISGSADSFDPGILELMQPLVATCAQLIVAHRNDLRRRAAEQALAEERVLLAQRVAERTAALSYSNAELARTARAKDEFLATMNHELRTPLNAVILYADSLQTQLPGPLNERQLRAVNGIRESANHLLLLINDILDVAKMDAGKLGLDITPCAVDTVCQSSLRLVSEMAQKKRLELHFDFAANVSQVDADERRLKQMIVNLLSNAIKFTPEGGKVGLEVVGDCENNTIRFTVWDTGIGISQTDIKKLFQPFVQLDGSHARQHGGTGLGLFLVYRMAELHGGGISATSELNQGSRFTIALPWHKERVVSTPGSVAPSFAVQGIFAQSTEEIVVEQASKQSGSTHPLAPNGAKGHANGHAHTSTPHTGPRYANEPATVKTNSSLLDHIPSILIADDNEANIRVLSDFLQEWHCRLLIARTGIEAVQQAKEEQPDLILMDVQMPEMNGLDAIRLIRLEDGLKFIPIVALTALAMPGDREQCLAAGADAYLCKPIQIERLTEVLQANLKSMAREESL
jgi:signal transduction histidine kinase/CheY-like chemotaxis protein